MAETVKHTPGPWFALEKSGPNVARVVSEEGNNIAFLSAMNGRSKDDCHLISAAPDLLATARDFVLMPCETLGVEDLEGGCCRTCRARDAIAKAEGRS